ncbi:hypothetical protein BF49_3770 [Bradyrhizobium sp.]|uniref:hypothetical protein n=1 Tax=Bradyrhizobium sp. TaxID=376 RepID=UPI0007C190BE|nr:hypothetical protein [Bradyrhizobium sp.]CUT12690.1 hypothetical protein BF49_3770 [Bradyrhizobium sp.]
MAWRAVSREDFRSLFALYAFVAKHNRNHDGEHLLLTLFTSSRNIPDDLLIEWSERVEPLNPETVGGVLCPRARAVAKGEARYDHASAFLHSVLKALDETAHVGH